MTETKGCFLFKEGEVSPWRTEADALLKEHQINRAVETPDGRYIIGTLSGGIFSIASDGSLEWMIDVSGGLQNNTVLALLCDYSGNIWVALDDGISYIDRMAGVYVYRPQNHYIGMIYDMLIDGNDTYLATNQGLYLSSDGSGLKRVSGLDEQTWFIEKVYSTIYCGYNVGVFSIKDHQAELVSEEGGGTFCIRKIAHKDSTFILAGTYKMPCLYKEKGNDEWEYLPTFENNLQMLRNMEYDGQGNVWGEHFKSGLVRLSLSPDFRRVTEEMKYSTLGEVSDTVFNVMNINGRVVFTNGRRFFTYESVHDEIVPYEVMNRDLNELKNVHQAVHVKDSYYWLVGDRRITLVECRKDSFRVIRSLPYSLFGISVEERSSVICDSSTGNTYLLMSNLIVSIDDAVFMHPIRDSYIPLELVSMTAADREGTVINVPLTDGVRIGYRYNTVDFRLRYPVYSGFDINMRCRLDGLTDEWIYRGRDLAQKFTRLRSGKYVFEAEVYAGEEVLATTSIDFVIRKPWYASWWMLFVYVALASIVYGIFYQMSVRKMKAENRRRIEEQKLKMQQQKEAMLEEDVRQKSKDLASMSMAVIAHNDVLDSILKEINEQRSGKITRTLDKIQHIVQNSLISNNEHWDVFQANFDRVHENFFRKLKDRYPDLTSTDLRLCALLRLNLSTKEIAKMLNLTVRGVESARYRLRKKLELPAEASLTDFMINFK